MITENLPLIRQSIIDFERGLSIFRRLEAAIVAGDEVTRMQVLEDLGNYIDGPDAPSWVRA